MVYNDYAVKALIFGVNGQDGYYLKQLIERNMGEIYGVSRKPHPEFINGSVGDSILVAQLVRDIRPDYIFHLAANSTTHYDALFENHETISTGTINILDATWKYSKHSKVFLCGSGLQFVNNCSGITEFDPFEARDPYSVSRIQSVYAARYFRKLGLEIYIGYLFNHDSPLRSSRHVNQKIAQAARRIELGSKEFLELGDLEVRKEFSFAGDIVNAIWRLINNKRGVFEAVIGSGKAYPIRQWVELCFTYYGLNWENHVVLKKGFEADYSILVSKPDTIFSLGWQPEVEISQLCKMFVQA
jgi:GDPmannose 4,6-dehydratase